MVILGRLDDTATRKGLDSVPDAMIAACRYVASTTTIAREGSPPVPPMDIRCAPRCVFVQVGGCQVRTVIVCRVECGGGIVSLDKVLAHGETLDTLNHRAARPGIGTIRTLLVIEGEHETGIRRV